jgi:hypothetical protein
MTNGRNLAITAAIAAVLSAPLAIGSHPARADELSDLRANQELLQRRLDQLAQAPDKNAGIGGYLGPTSGGPVAVQTMGGSFPRSFLIPGTDTSIRIGGQIEVNASYWITGGNPHTTPQTGNGGSTGTAYNMALSGSGVAAAVATPISRSRRRFRGSMSKRAPRPRGARRVPSSNSIIRAHFRPAAGRPRSPTI